MSKWVSYLAFGVLLTGAADAQHPKGQVGYPLAHRASNLNISIISANALAAIR